MSLSDEKLHLIAIEVDRARPSFMRENARELLEAAHQIDRWGADHDAGKTPWDWFWTVGYLAQKAASAALAGDTDKAKHHTISTSALLLNWHRRLSGEAAR